MNEKYPVKPKVKPGISCLFLSLLIIIKLIYGNLRTTNMYLIKRTIDSRGGLSPKF